MVKRANFTLLVMVLDLTLLVMVLALTLLVMVLALNPLRWPSPSPSL